MYTIWCIKKVMGFELKNCLFNASHKKNSKFLINTYNWFLWCFITITIYSTILHCFLIVTNYNTTSFFNDEIVNTTSFIIFIIFIITDYFTETSKGRLGFFWNLVTCIRRIGVNLFCIRRNSNPLPFCIQFLVLITFFLFPITRSYQPVILYVTITITFWSRIRISFLLQGV